MGEKMRVFEVERDNTNAEVKRLQEALRESNEKLSFVQADVRGRHFEQQSRERMQAEEIFSLRHEFEDQKNIYEERIERLRSNCRKVEGTLRAVREEMAEQTREFA